MTTPQTDAPTLQERLRDHGFHGSENVLHRTRRWTVERMASADALDAHEATIAALVEALELAWDYMTHHDGEYDCQDQLAVIQSALAKETNNAHK